MNDVVVDTSILFIRPQPWEIPEIGALDQPRLLIPATALWELDLLAQRPETRNRARAALNVIRNLIDRGALHTDVVVGAATARLMVTDSLDTVGKDLNLADDRILAEALSFSNGGDSVALATTEIALYAKALALGLRGYLLDGLTPETYTLTTRERNAFRDTWSRVIASTSPWIMGVRLGAWYRSRLVQRTVGPVRVSGDPA